MGSRKVKEAVGMGFRRTAAKRNRGKSREREETEREKELDL